MRKWTILLVAVIAFAVFMTVHIYERSRTPSLDPICDHASFRANDWGTKALRQLLSENGLTTASWERLWGELDNERGLLWVIHPMTAPSRDEVEALLDWVQMGNWVVIAPDPRTKPRGMTLGDEGGGAILLARLGWGTVDAGRPNAPVPAGVTDRVELRDVQALEVPAAARLIENPTKQQIQKSLSEHIVRRGDTAGLDQPLAELPAQVIVKDTAGIVAAVLTHGSGRMILLCDADILANQWVARRDNFLLAGNVAFAAPGNRIWFDEYHHGMTADASDGLDTTAPRAAIWAMMAALGLYFLGKLWRFGKPRPLDDQPRRAAVEYVRAFAQLYRSADQTTAALQMICKRFRTQLAAACGTAAKATDATLATIASERYSNIDYDELASLLDQCTSLSRAQEQLTDGQLLDVVQRISLIERELQSYGK